MATITKRGDTYRIRCSLGYDSKGKQVVRSTTWKPEPGMSEKQVQKELNRFAVLFEEKCRNGGDPHITFEKFAEKWLTEYARVRKELCKRQKRPKTAKAVKNELIERDPCSVAAPKKPASKIVCLDDEQARALLQALESEPLEDKVLFTLALLTGYRRGELLGLEWPDIDFEHGVITVRRTSQYTNGKGMYTDTPKTASSARSTKISPALVDLLREYKIEQARTRLERGDLWAAEWDSQPRLFTNLNGTPMQPSTPEKRLGRILERAGLPHVSLHSLRHTFASRAMEQGMDAKTLSMILGHASVSFTMDTYTHVLNTHKVESMALMGELFDMGQASHQEISYPVIATPEVGGYAFSAHNFPGINFSVPDLYQGLQHMKEHLQEELLISICPPEPMPANQIILDAGQLLLQIPV